MSREKEQFELMRDSNLAQRLGCEDGSVVIPNASITPGTLYSTLNRFL